MRYLRTSAILLLILFNFSAAPPVLAQQAVYLIRHAEQARDVEDPPLTKTGKRRAKGWASTLRDTGIKLVYTSKKRRTKQTGQYIAHGLNIPSQTMSRRDVAGLVNRIRTQNAEDQVLIVSHSRTIPKLLKELGYSQDITIKKSDYGSLFIIAPKANDDPVVVHLRYE